MATRPEVYAAVDSERDYQTSLPSTRTDGSDHTVGDYVTMLQHYQTELVKAWTLNAGTAPALEVMRKIAGIAVHCMEDHGAPQRKGFERAPLPDMTGFLQPVVQFVSPLEPKPLPTKLPKPPAEKRRIVIGSADYDYAKYRVREAIQKLPWTTRSDLGNDAERDVRINYINVGTGTWKINRFSIEAKACWLNNNEYPSAGDFIQRAMIERFGELSSLEDIIRYLFED